MYYYCVNNSYSYWNCTLLIFSKGIIISFIIFTIIWGRRFKVFGLLVINVGLSCTPFNLEVNGTVIFSNTLSKGIISVKTRKPSTGKSSKEIPGVVNSILRLLNINKSMGGQFRRQRSIVNHSSENVNRESVSIYWWKREPDYCGVNQMSHFIDSFWLYMYYNKDINQFMKCVFKPLRIFRNLSLCLFYKSQGNYNYVFDIIHVYFYIHYLKQQ